MRHRVNRHKARRSFNKRSRKTAVANLRTLRGGGRL